MKILVAEDDRFSSHLLERTLSGWGHEAVLTNDGVEAWSALEQVEAPKLAILDWMMPGVDGLEICRRLRQIQSPTPTYVIMLTAKGNKADIVEGLMAGANDYVIKPFDRAELKARLDVGITVVNLQQSLATRVVELEVALEHVKLLQGILPMCSYCKQIRDDSNYWQSVESYISQHSEAKFSHGICPGCYESVVQRQLDEFKEKANLE
jgi:phosphoserine phosphatase RsbU/P